MGERFGIVFLTTVLIALVLQSQGATAQPDTTPSPSVTILETQEAQSILGRDVRSLTDEDMGRIVDILVDGEGGVRAAIIDFGGFL
ncbi:MAG TPA: PRC-barrel domain-containing protein, partial [Reyranella sp.]|nr:PRC-barrel domain-containing protein [Reyranella sp.]